MDGVEERDPARTATLEAYADTIIPGSKRTAKDRAIAGVVSDGGAVQAGAQEDPGAWPQFLGIIERNAERLQDLVEDVLNLSHIESHKLRLNMEGLDLRSAYTQALSSFREKAARKQITLSSEIAEDLPRVLADRRALERMDVVPRLRMADRAMPRVHGAPRLVLPRAASFLWAHPGSDRGDVGHLRLVVSPTIFGDSDGRSCALPFRGCPSSGGPVYGFSSSQSDAAGFDSPTCGFLRSGSAGRLVLMPGRSQIPGRNASSQARP